MRVTRSRRPSPQTLAVLRALAERPEHWHHGYELCTRLDLRAGSMYPILMRLADRGLLETDWETDRASGRPPRHLYRLTGAGREYVAALEPDAAPAPSRQAPSKRAARPSLGGA